MKHEKFNENKLAGFHSLCHCFISCLFQRYITLAQVFRWSHTKTLIAVCPQLRSFLENLGIIFGQQHSTIQIPNSSFLQFILNVLIKTFNHDRGIILFRTYSLFERILKPTLVSFVFMIIKYVCLVVKIWLRLRLIPSSE